MEAMVYRFLLGEGVGEGLYRVFGAPWYSGYVVGSSGF